jgi:hypothetical protein
MAKLDLPRRDSAAHMGLRALHNIGGQSFVPAWMRVVDWRGSQLNFSRDVVDRLQRAGLIEVAGAFCAVTSTGRSYLGVQVHAQPQAPAEPVGAPYKGTVKPLNRAKHFPPRPQRPEGDEYRAIPSLMAGQRIEYRPGAVAADA